MSEARKRLERGDAVDQAALRLMDCETARHADTAAVRVARRERARRSLGVMACCAVLLAGGTFCASAGGGGAPKPGSAVVAEVHQMSGPEADALIARWDRLLEEQGFRSPALVAEVPAILAIRDGHLPAGPARADMLMFRAARILRSSPPEPGVVAYLDRLMDSPAGNVARAAALSMKRVYPEWGNDPRLRLRVEAALLAPPSTGGRH